MDKVAKSPICFWAKNPPNRETAPHLPVAVLSGLQPEQLEGAGADQVYYKGDGEKAVAGIANFAHYAMSNPRREPADVKPTVRP